jgi:hypothetical protein
VSPLVKLELTPRIVIAVAWIAFCGSYCVWAGIEQRNWLSGLFGVTAVVGAVGVALRWQWSQWLVYVIAASILMVWLYGLFQSVRAGAFPYETLQLTVLGLVPGFVLLAATLWSADIVRRRFRRHGERL